MDIYRLIRMEMQQIDEKKDVEEPSPSPPAVITEIIRNVEYEYRFMSTVHSLEQLDNFRFQHGCTFGNAKVNSNFTRTTLRCTKQNKLDGRGGGKCQFSLMAWRPFPGDKNIIHVYANSKHNHTLKPEVERAVFRMPRNKLVPDADPPANFTAKDGRQWTMLGTVNDLKGVDNLQLKHHCKYGKDKPKYNRMSMQCNNPKCKFCLLALKTDRGRYHMYANGRHTCRYANDNGAAVGTKSKNAGKDVRGEVEEEEQMDIDVEALEWPISLIQRLLSVALQEGNAGLVDKLMAKTGQRRIGALLQTLDRSDMIKLLQMAERESGEGHSSKENASSSDWLVWVRETLREVLLLLSLTQNSQITQVHKNFVDSLLGQGMSSSSSSV